MCAINSLVVAKVFFMNSLLTPVSLALRSGNIVNNEGHTELRLLLVENFNQYPDLLA